MYKTQVRVKEYNAGAYIYVWRDIHPTGGTAYIYDTHDQAELAIRHANDGARTRADYRVVYIPDNKEV